MERRDEMIAEKPETYFFTEHYLGYTWILVRQASPNSSWPSGLDSLNEPTPIGSATRSHFTAEKAHELFTLFSPVVKINSEGFSK